MITIKIIRSYQTEDGKIFENKLEEMKHAIDEAMYDWFYKISENTLSHHARDAAAQCLVNAIIKNSDDYDQLKYILAEYANYLTELNSTQDNPS